jgi:hypothetical protein
MRRGDEYRLLTNSVRKRVGDEESAVMKAQWEILAGRQRTLGQRRSMIPVRMMN